MSRYHLERDGGSLSGAEIDPNKWWSLGLWPDLTSVVQFMVVYDPFGTVRMRVWDIEQNVEVPAWELGVLAMYLENKRRHQPDPKVDWINDGF